MMKKLRLLENFDQEKILLKECIFEKGLETGILEILEAGCGRYWPFNQCGIRCRLTGVDIDKNSLEIRKSKFDDLDEIIVGDLRNIEIKGKKYDLIYCSFVLEHIDNAHKVLQNFSDWLKQGGIIILKIPDRNSVYGFFTRVTPHWFHIFYRKYVEGFYNAGKLGYGPYPVFYDLILSRNGIHQFCKDYKFEIKEEYGQANYLLKRNFLSIILKSFSICISVLSFGKLSWKHNNLIFVLRKNN
jgi:ubiquinone/menaquinone biosynthesis C-methylase UbiE